MIDTDTREAELKALSWEGAPKMVTEAPGPQVQALMEESAKYESFTRGGGGFPVILSEGKGVTVKDADGNLYIDMAAGVAVNAVGRNHPKVLDAIRRQCDVIMHTTDITNPKRIELAKKVSSVMPEGLRGNCHTAVYQAGSDAVETAIKFARAYTGRSQLDRLPRRLPRRLDGHRGADHRLQLPPRLGPDDARRAAPALRLLLPLPVRQGVPLLRHPVRQVRGRRAERPLHRRRRRRRRGHREPAGRGRLRGPAARVPRDGQGRLREERLPVRRRRGAVGRRPHRQDVGHPVLQGPARHAHLGQGHGRRHAHGRRLLPRRDGEGAARGLAAVHLRRQRHGLRGRDDQHRPHHRPGDRPLGRAAALGEEIKGLFTDAMPNVPVHRRRARQRPHGRHRGRRRPQDQGAAGRREDRRDHLQAAQRRHPHDALRAARQRVPLHAAAHHPPRTAASPDHHPRHDRHRQGDT